jgi:hypothetical protein
MTYSVHDFKLQRAGGYKTIRERHFAIHLALPVSGYGPSIETLPPLAVCLCYMVPF